MAHLRQEDLRVLEQSRQRLYQLSQTINSLKADVMRSTPMPQWESIQYQASILASNLQSITDHLSSNADLFSRVVAYPSTNYPGRTQENTLALLLRKKAEPGVESWMDEGRAALVNGRDDATEDIEDLWNFASESVGQMVGRTVLRTMRDAYTKEERENGVESVRTGLRKPPKEEVNEGESDDSDEEEEESDDEGDGNGAAKRKEKVPGAKTLDDLMMFMASGRAAGERV